MILNLIPQKQTVTRMMFIKHYAPNRCLCIKVGGGGGGRGGGICTKNGNYCEGGGQGRCERRSEAFVKIQKKKKKFWWGGGGGVGLRGVRVDVN